MFGTGKVVRVVVVAAGVLGLAASPAAADQLLTPQGPASLREQYTGPVATIGLLPSVIVEWSATVGQGGAAGPVRLQTFHDAGATATVVGASPTVQLPAEPGQYAFPIPAGQGIRSESGYYTLGITQQVGGHAILQEAPAPDPASPFLGGWVVDVFAPSLADDAQGVPSTDRLAGRRLAVSVKTERDIDQDGLGDLTQDVGDLQLVSVEVAEHRPDRALVVARIRNVGTTVRDRPSLSIGTADSAACDCGPALSPALLVPPLAVICGCAGIPALAPGAETEVRRWVELSHGEPAKVVVGAEGNDTNPVDNSGEIPPYLRLRVHGSAPQLGALKSGGLRVSIGSARPATVTLSARAGGVDFGRRITFARADRRVVTLRPARRADRRRLTAALRRPGRLAAIVTATAGGGHTGVRAKF